jgi:hypothetical protein
MSVNFPAGHRTKPRPGRLSRLAIPAAISNIGLTLADRKVREIVTVSGRGVRGHFPSYKGKLLKFESLIEEDALRIFNVASSVTSLITQPCVFAIPGSPRLRYTPDLRATMYGQDYFFEIKPADFQKNPHVTTRLLRVIPHFKTSQTPFLLILDTDLRPAGLQEELKALLRQRPAPGRYDPTLDSVQWDPRQTQTAPPALLHRWYAAQRECDALLQRVMRRDPDAFFEQI